MATQRLNSASWLWPAMLGVGLVTLMRVVLLAFNQTDLFVDEAQYWLWGQQLDFGYYSKPPMIGWVIRLFTEIGFDTAFWIRLPAPLFHGATALILGAIAARLFDRRAAILVALCYVTLPVVALGSLLISTDTIMFPFLALSLLFYLRVLDDGGWTNAALAGAMLGLAFLGKYAAIYYVLCALLVSPVRRPSLRDTLVILAAFMVAASPNLIWNLANGLTTVEHTLDNADWVRDSGARAGLNWDSLAEFFGAQFAVFGPILMGGYLVAVARFGRLTQPQRILVGFSVPILVLVCGQAVLSQAYANWAVATYLAGIALVAPMLTRPWLVASFVINGALCALFPVASVAPTLLQRDGQPLLNRYIRRHEMSTDILAVGQKHSLSTIVAQDRDILADLFFTARDEPVSIFAIPPKGRPKHHYAQKFPYQPRDEDMLLVLRAGATPPCYAEYLADIAPDTGAYRRHPMSLYRAPATCFSPESGT